MLYRPNSASATTSALTITGRNLAHGRRSIPHRAFIGAGLHRNHITLTDPTVRQSASLVSVSVPYVAAAVIVLDDQDLRDAVTRGDLNLIDAAKRMAGREFLADHIRRSSPIELAAAAKEAGVDFVWDAMMAPNL